MISHRGNIDGPNKELENYPSYILKAIQQGYDVEVDVWYRNERYFLGHDKPEYEVDIDFLKNKKIWCHCKNIDALEKLLDNDIHCFFHNTDAVTLTSEGFLWTYPGKKLTKSSICVLPEDTGWTEKSIVNISGICSDYISKYRKIIEGLK